MAVLLVCEGDVASLDVRVLNRVVIQPFGLNVQTMPAGGNASLGSVASWLEHHSKVKGQPTNVAYAIADRNYAPLSKCQDTWRADSKRFIWQRHEIENYLLDPRVIAMAFAHLRATTPKWPATAPDTPAAVETLLQQLAQPLFRSSCGLAYLSNP